MVSLWIHNSGDCFLCAMILNTLKRALHKLQESPISTQKQIYISTQKQIYISTQKQIYISTQKQIYISTMRGTASCVRWSPTLSKQPYTHYFERALIPSKKWTTHTQKKQYSHSKKNVVYMCIAGGCFICAMISNTLYATRGVLSKASMDMADPGENMSAENTFAGK